MKYIKKYENVFSVGQIVVCINNYDCAKILDEYEMYEVEKYYKEDDNDKITLKGIRNLWYTRRFRGATPQEIEIYKLRNDMKKYNI